MSMGQWNECFKIKKSVLFLFVLTIVSSTLYVVYLEQMGQLSKEMLQQYVIQKGMPFETKYFLGVFIGYLKKCILVWFLGWFSFFAPLSFVMAFIYIFSYGFSITSLYIGFGLEGVGISLLTFGIQGILMVSYLLYLEDHILKRIQVFKQAEETSYIKAGVIGIGVAFLITIIEVLMMGFL